MEIKSLAGIDVEKIYTAFSLAFANYEVQINKTQFLLMLKRRGFEPEVSFAAFNKNEIIAFTLNGIGYFQGILTAYDAGTGTLQEYRGTGLATKIFDYSIPCLKAMGINQYLLEVLQHNTKAVAVYKKLGFETSREFNYFIQENTKIVNEIKSTSSHYLIKPTSLEYLKDVAGFSDFYPSWQNSFEAVNRNPDGFHIFAAYDKEQIIGYCICEPVTGDITQLAVGKGNRRKGIASLLLHEAMRLNKSNVVKIVNTD